MEQTNNDENINKLFEEYLSDISSNENSDEFLKSEGFEPDKLVDDGIRKIKQIRNNK